MDANRKREKRNIIKREDRIYADIEKKQKRKQPRRATKTRRKEGRSHELARIDTNERLGKKQKKGHKKKEKDLKVLVKISVI